MQEQQHWWPDHHLPSLPQENKTFIRPAEYTDPKPCQLIYGVNANALYLWSTMQQMPTGHFVRRKKEDGFKRQAQRRYERMAINWLEWEAKNSGQHIRHQGNDREKAIGRRRLPVNGFCKDTVVQKYIWLLYQKIVIIMHLLCFIP